MSVTDSKKQRIVGIITIIIIVALFVLLLIHQAQHIVTHHKLTTLQDTAGKTVTLNLPVIESPPQTHRPTDTLNAVGDNTTTTTTSTAQDAHKLVVGHVSPPAYQQLAKTAAQELQRQTQNQQRQKNIQHLLQFNSLKKTNHQTVPNNNDINHTKTTSSPIVNTNTTVQQTSGAWVVQVASFRDVKRAANLVNTLEKQNIHAFYQHAIAHAQTVYRVYVGPAPNTTEAHYLQDKIQQQFHLSGFVKKYKDFKHV